MSNTNTGGPAFPTGTWEYDGQGNVLPYQEPGMTLRDYMAIHASEEDVRAIGEIIRAKSKQGYGTGILPDNWRTTARYMHADAMIKAREGGAA